MPIRVESDSPEDFIKLFDLMGQRFQGVQEQPLTDTQPHLPQPTYQPQIAPRPPRMMLPQATIQQERATLIQPDIQIERTNHSPYLQSTPSQSDPAIAELREQFTLLQQQLEAIAYFQQQAPQANLPIADTTPAPIVRAETAGQLTAKTAIPYAGNLLGKALDNTWICLAVLIVALGLAFGPRSLPNSTQKLEPPKTANKQPPKPKTPAKPQTTPLPVPYPPPPPNALPAVR